MTDASQTHPPVEVFFSYAHEDEELRNELEKHLSILKRQGVIASWHDRRIGAGSEWAGEIDSHLDTSGVILLLISPDFLASDYCWDVELDRAMQRHQSGQARVIPVILRPVDWRGAPFGKLQALPIDARPVTSWPDQDAALYNVAQGIRSAVERLSTPPASERVDEMLPSSPFETQKQSSMGSQNTSEEGTRQPASGGVSISAGRDATIGQGAIVAGGDVTDARITITESNQGTDLAAIKALFDPIYQAIESAELAVDKEIVQTTVEQIEAQVTQPDAPPDESKVERLMRTLKAMAPDIFDVALATLINPPAGVALVIKKIGAKIKAESGQGAPST